jgi:hypothetical protein
MKVKVYANKLPFIETGLIPHFTRRMNGITISEINPENNYFLLNVGFTVGNTFQDIEVLQHNLVRIWNYFEERFCKIERIEFL